MYKGKLLSTPRSFLTISTINYFLKNYEVEYLLVPVMWTDSPDCHRVAHVVFLAMEMKEREESVVKQE